MANDTAYEAQHGLFAPLRMPTFRRIWLASVLGNFGQLILGVGAAWEMTRLTNSPSMVALVQTALMLPLLLAFFVWRRRHIPSRLPPERIDRAIVSGARYAFHARAIRIVLIRSLLFGLAGATASALAPLIAKDLLDGNAGTYGMLLGFSGAGAVLGALATGWFRERFGTEGATRVLAVVGGAAIAVTGLSHSLWLTCAALFVAGGANILTIALFNIAVQLAAPRWVTARALSLFSSALTGGIAIGAAFWGFIAAGSGLQTALCASGALLALSQLLGLLLPLPEVARDAVEPAKLGNELEVGLALTLRSWPISVAIDYRVDPANAREFYNAMRAVQRTRLRISGFAWSLARDIADPASWTERYSCPTWGDYLRMRDRSPWPTRPRRRRPTPSISAVPRRCGGGSSGRSVRSAGKRIRPMPGTMARASSGLEGGSNVQTPACDPMGDRQCRHAGLAPGGRASGAGAGRPVGE